MLGWAFLNNIINHSHTKNIKTVPLSPLGLFSLVHHLYLVSHKILPILSFQMSLESNPPRTTSAGQALIHPTLGLAQ